MRAMNWIIGGAIGGAIGAVVWAAVAYFSGYETGIVAWVVGVLVGAGVRGGVKNEHGVGPGMAAALVAVVAVLLGKYAAVNLYEATADVSFEEGFTAEGRPTDEFAISFIADDVAMEWAWDGREIIWPDGVDPDDASQESDYPRTVWAEAERRWSELSPEEQDWHRQDISAEFGYGEDTEAAFVHSFSPFDVVWMFLAVGTAFKLGSGSHEKQPPV